MADSGRTTALAVVGLDVGSSGCKALALNGAGDVLATALRPYPTLHPRPGWSEQSPENWYAAAGEAVRACLASPRMAGYRVVGLSVDGPAHSVALLDGAGGVIAPTIHTSDLRSTPQAERLERECGDRILEITFQRPNPSWTLAHLLWLKANEPDVFGRLRKIRVVKDFVRSRMTGDDVTDDYDAIGTQLYDIRSRAWSEELLDLVGLTTSVVPQVAKAFDLAGTLRDENALEFGLPRGTPVAVGGGDSIVEALGAGVVRPGQATVKLGTHANVNVVTAQARPAPGLISYRHLIDDLGFTIAATNSGAASLRWLRDTFMGGDAGSEADIATKPAEIGALVEQVPAGCDGLMFHPYLMGERTPYWDPLMRGSFIGIGAHHRLEHFARAVFEGVAFSLCDCVSAHESAPEPSLIQDAWLLGGGSNIAAWRQIVCDVLGRPLSRPRAEGAAFGAAMLAGVAVGMFDGWADAVRTCVKVRDVVSPDRAAHALYSKMFDIYRDAARDLARHSRKLVRLTT